MHGNSIACQKRSFALAERIFDPGRGPLISTFEPQTQYSAANPGGDRDDDELSGDHPKPGRRGRCAFALT
jgi:hypothetical protein